MAYAQDTIISANAANSLATVLDGLLTTAGWSVVETLSPAGTFTPQTKVYKSDGTSNAAGYDWYLAIMWKALGTEAQMRIIPGAAYDAPSHTISQIPFGLEVSYADNITGDSWGGYNVNVATNTTVNVASDRGASPTPQSWFSTIVPSSAFGYWASVTLDHVSLYTTINDATPGPASFFASTLDVDPDWAALNTDGFGNGVAVNPVVMFSRNAGISTSIIGISNSVNPGIQTTTRYANVVGLKLPALDGDWLPAYAWRSAWYWVKARNLGTPGTPPWDGSTAGDGFYIGSGIDYYQVWGGSIGDTVEILGATYVLSGLITGADGTTGAYVAVLVE